VGVWSIQNRKENEGRVSLLRLAVLGVEGPSTTSEEREGITRLTGMERRGGGVIP